MDLAASHTDDRLSSDEDPKSSSCVDSASGIVSCGSRVCFTYWSSFFSSDGEHSLREFPGKHTDPSVDLDLYEMLS
ncbi:hypothetical protein L1987_58147 [Smallanthus sonchifolius]|uniref:Uncharacterized protein n=1 Tax=Smallanthus sonchifolius TaxID=185202 RepID=A0ACB9DFH8_9ASTR|nr:hypothetical protein L1987_58147 [Smallanthus sonchifolius]